MNRITFVLAIVLFSIQIVIPRSVFAQSPIVLRDLSLIRDKAISDFDRNAITLSDGSKLAWDRVLKAELSGEPESKTAPSRQPEFDRNLKQVGLPLFRLKTRIKQGDWAGAGKIAGPMFDSVTAGKSDFPNPDIEYLVCLATMKSRTGQGSAMQNRASAVLPFLRASWVESSVNPKTIEMVAAYSNAEKPNAEKRADGLSPELLPVWFNVDQIQSSLKQIEQLPNLEANTTPDKANMVGKEIYLASMQIELDQTDQANATLNRLNRNRSKLVDAWRIVLRARMLQRSGNHVQAQSMLDKNSDSIIGDARPVAIYYRGLSEFEIHSRDGKIETPLNSAVDTDLSNSSLMLLRLPALYGESHPELAAAGLYHVAEIAKLRGHLDQSKKLSRELLQRYPRTYHGSLKPKH